MAHEHALTAAVGDWLGQVRLEAPPPWRPGSVVLACGPRDDHALGLDCLATLLAHRGVDGRLLAARTPVASLVLAVQESGATAAVVVSHLAGARSSAVDAIRAVAATSARAYYGGAAFRAAQSRVRLPGTFLGDVLTRAADRLVAEVSEPVRS